LLSLELLEANFLFCFPYPIHIFADKEITDDEIHAIKDSVPSAPSVTFEPVCFQNCQLLNSDGNVTESKGSLPHLSSHAKDSFIAFHMFSSENVKGFELYWYLEPSVFITVGSSFIF